MTNRKMENLDALITDIRLTWEIVRFMRNKAAGYVVFEKDQSGKYQVTEQANLLVNRKL